MSRCTLRKERQRAAPVEDRVPSSSQPVEHDSRRYRDVQRLDTRFDLHGDQLRRGSACQRRKSAPFIAHRERQPCRQPLAVSCPYPKWLALRIRPPEYGSGLGKERGQRFPGTRQCGVMKVSPHRATDDFGVPEVNGSREADDCRGPQCGGGSKNRADIAGILNGVQNDEAKGLLLLNIW